MWRAVEMCDGAGVFPKNQHCESGLTSCSELAHCRQKFPALMVPGWSAGTMTAWRSRRVCHASATYASSAAISARVRWLAALTGTTKFGSAWNANASSGTCTQAPSGLYRTAAERRPVERHTCTLCTLCAGLQPTPEPAVRQGCWCRAGC